MLIETLPIHECKSAGRGLFLLRSVLETLSAWRARARERRLLASLDARELRDIGISAYDRGIECEKPFWRG